MTRDLQWMASTLQAADWIVPAYIQIGAIGELASAVHAAPDAQKHVVLARALPHLYSPDDLAVMLLERYSRVEPVATFKTEIAEAIEASQLGLMHCAVVTLVPVLEGILRKLASARGKTIGPGTRKLVTELDHLIDRERLSSPGFDERVIMLQTFRDFVRDRLLRSTPDYSGVGNLNRHGIVHGVFTQYGSDFNFYRAVSFLDLLCFTLVFRNGAMSVLAPSATDRSRTLAEYYRALQRLRPVALLAGARP